VQPGSHLSRQGWPRLLPVLLDPLEHLQAARQIERHPFDETAPAADDIEFAFRGLLDKSCAIVPFRKRLLRHIRCKSKGMAHLQHALLQVMPLTVKAVAGSVNIAMLVYLSILCAHCDVTFAVRMLFGFRILGHVENVPLFRSTEAWADRISKEELLASANDYIDQLQAEAKPSKDPAQDTEMLKLCKKDLARGGAAGFFDKATMNARHGEGQWRPLRRFCIQQAEKWRAIDDGKASLHNRASSFGTKVHTVTHDTLIATCRMFFTERLSLCGLHGSTAALEAGVEDESAAYRWKPASPEDLNCLVIAFYHKDEHAARYLELWSHPFGLASSVVNYNRGPALAMSIMRQLFRVMVYIITMTMP
jgi:hypothetical protein